MITATYPITGGDFAAAGAATRALKEQLNKLGVEPAIFRRIMIASYEAEMNVVIHAWQGNLWARLNQGRIDIEVVDHGPGIPDIEQAMKAGYSTAPMKARQLGFGAGMGLPNIRKASDLFEIDSKVGRGTRVRSAIYLKKLAAAEVLHNSLAVREGRCRSCLAACPTRALRLRDGSPIILQHLCIDCTACLAACGCGALALRQDVEEQPALAVVEGSALVVPLPFLNGFPQAGPQAVRRALAGLGFRELHLTDEWEAALSEAALSYARKEAARLPVISPVCPAAVNWIETHFPSLIPQLAPFLSPVEAAREEHNLQPLVVAVACPGQATVLYPGSLPGRLQILSPARLAEALRALLAGGRPDRSNRETPREPVEAVPGAAPLEGVLRVTGVRHVRRVLEKAEAGVLEGIELLEPYLCDQGCWGSPLFPEDPFLSRHRASVAPWLSEGRDAAGAGQPSGQGAEPVRTARRTRPRAAPCTAVPAPHRDAARRGHGHGHAQAGPPRRADPRATGAGLRVVRRPDLRLFGRGHRHGPFPRRRLPAPGGREMTLKLIAERLQLSALTPALPLDDLAEVRAAHASDLLSDVLANARAGACCSRSRCI